VGAIAPEPSNGSRTTMHSPSASPRPTSPAAKCLDLFLVRSERTSLHRLSSCHHAHHSSPWLPTRPNIVALVWQTASWPGYQWLAVVRSSSCGVSLPAVRPRAISMLFSTRSLTWEYRHSLGHVPLIEKGARQAPRECSSSRAVSS
jgi:hypothetical protein